VTPAVVPSAPGLQSGWSWLDASGWGLTAKGRAVATVMMRGKRVSGCIVM